MMNLTKSAAATAVAWACLTTACDGDAARDFERLVRDTKDAAQRMRETQGETAQVAAIRETLEISARLEAVCSNYSGEPPEWARKLEGGKARFRAICRDARSAANELRRFLASYSESDSSDPATSALMQVNQLGKEWGAATDLFEGSTDVRVQKNAAMEMLALVDKLLPLCSTLKDGNNVPAKYAGVRPAVTKLCRNASHPDSLRAFIRQATKEGF